MLYAQLHVSVHLYATAEECMRFTRAGVDAVEHRKVSCLYSNKIAQNYLSIHAISSYLHVIRLQTLHKTATNALNILVY
jgi:hypothetical protein